MVECRRPLDKKEAFEYDMISKAQNQCADNRKEMASLIGCTVKTLRSRMKKYGLITPKPDHLIDPEKEKKVEGSPQYQDYLAHKKLLIESKEFIRLSDDDKPRAMENVFKLYFQSVPKRKRHSKDPDKEAPHKRDPMFPFRYPDQRERDVSEKLHRDEIGRIEKTATYRMLKDWEKKEVRDRVRARYLCR